MRSDRVEKIIIGNDDKARRFIIVAKDKSIFYSGYAGHAKEDFETIMEEINKNG